MPDEKKPFHNPFAALEALRASLPERPPLTPASSSPPAPPKPAASSKSGIPRAVVRLERSGRGGKEVTIVEHLDIGSSEREAWLKSLKAALGCGGKIEDGSLMFQGDQRDRLAKLLAERGVRKVTVGHK